ncbi:hypothetical protein VTK26DRAFT_1925 [Humicola hyalothermophila]
MIQEADRFSTLGWCLSIRVSASTANAFRLPRAVLPELVFALHIALTGNCDTSKDMTRCCTQGSSRRPICSPDPQVHQVKFQKRTQSPLINAPTSSQLMVLISTFCLVSICFWWLDYPLRRQPGSYHPSRDLVRQNAEFGISRSKRDATIRGLDGRRRVDPCHTLPQPQQDGRLTMCGYSGAGKVGRV